MQQDERDIYLIPPNFIEGGTLLGGMFKTRNVVEAGILAAVIGLPVLNLNLSLTTRIIILCLTALPVVLLALVGISGSSLSAFILQFISYLRNRRILSCEGVSSRSTGKSLLPSWAQKNKSEETENETQLKSRNRIQFDFKERKVTQFKTFLPPEEENRPLNALADYVPIEKIENGIIYTRDHRYVKVVEVVPVNFLLRSAQEQRSIIYSFISYLKIAPTKVQFKVLTKRADIDRHVETVRKELERETDPHCRLLQEDYLKLIRQLGSREAITRRFFLIFEHEPLPGTKRGHEEEEAIASLQTVARTAANYLRQCGNTVLTSDDENEATTEILFHILCRKESDEHPFSQKVKQVLAEYIAAGRPIDSIPPNEFYAPSTVDFTHGRYICIDGTYYTYLLVPSNGYKAQVPAGWLSLIVNAGDGIDMDMFLTRQPKDRMIRKLGQQLRINRSKIREVSDTNTDFDDLDGAIRSGYFLKDGLGNNEDFYYLNLLITITADNVDDLEWKSTEMKKLLISQDMDAQPCTFCQEQAFLSSLPLAALEHRLYERSKRNVLTLGAASCYPFTSYEMCDNNGILLGVNKHNNSLTIVDTVPCRPKERLSIIRKNRRCPLDRAVLSQRITSILSDLNRLTNTLYALNMTDIQRYPENYEVLSTDAALRAEKITCRLRHLIYSTTNIKKGEYLASATVMQGIEIKYENEILEITLPCLFPKRKQKQGTEFLLDPFTAALSQYAKANPMPKMEHCVVCFSHVYNRDLPERRIRDYDNLELKQYLDVAASFILADDSGLLCDAYNTTEFGDQDCTRVIIMDSKRFPDWLDARQNTLKAITDL